MAGQEAVCHRVTVVLRGTERYHMEDYFLERGYTRKSGHAFGIDGLLVTLEEPQKVLLGAIQLTEVAVCLEGDRELAEAEAARFRLQFLTAGG